MIHSENPKSRTALSKELINLQDEYLSGIKDVRRSRSGKNVSIDYVGRSRYFTLESLFLLVCLTVSLLVLPVVLPPLPPPPFLLLLLPILILALLMLLALMPSGVREVTHAYS